MDCRALRQESEWCKTYSGAIDAPFKEDDLERVVVCDADLVPQRTRLSLATYKQSVGRGN